MNFASLQEVWNNTNTFSDLHPDIFRKQLRNIEKNSSINNDNNVEKIDPTEKFFIEGFKNNNYPDDIFQYPDEYNNIDDDNMISDNYATNINDIEQPKQKVSNKQSIDKIDLDHYFDKIINNIKIKKKLEKKYKIKIIKDDELNKMQNNNFLSKLLSEENKEILCIILIGIFIILVLDLFVQIGKNISIIPKK